MLEFSIFDHGQFSQYSSIKVCTRLELKNIDKKTKLRNSFSLVIVHNSALLLYIYYFWGAQHRWLSFYLVICPSLSRYCWCRLWYKITEYSRLVEEDMSVIFMQIKLLFHCVQVKIFFTCYFMFADVEDNKVTFLVRSQWFEAKGGL